MDMASGAGHDAQILRQLMPAAMLFIPSVGGVSHSFAEDSRAEDIVLGCEVAPRSSRVFCSVG
jgi:N-carbamoyl-L-amino-acid hydrolase